LRTAVALVAAIAVLVGGIVGFDLAPDHPLLRSVEVTAGPAVAASISGTWTVPGPPKPKHPTGFLVADAIVPTIELYSSPNVPMAPGQVDIPNRPGNVMTNPTWEGLPVVYLVKGHIPGWVHVQVSARPNGVWAWVPAADVRLRTVPNWIQVQLSTKQATVFHGDTPLFQTTVAVGRSDAPTPTGGYFVDGIVLLSNPDGPYGVAQISVSAFSDVYSTFGGGVGQIAMHGTDAPALIGQPVSHGCIRFTNDAIQQVLMRAPTGTPVEIIP
jgi:lipoprotein-anchoring transpeptidase ErfK/SrfK